MQCAPTKSVKCTLLKMPLEVAVNVSLELLKMEAEPADSYELLGGLARYR